MLLEISENELLRLVKKQLDSLFLFDPDRDEESLRSGLSQALKRSEYCFANTTNKYYQKSGSAYFNPYHSGQYSIFLYFLANSIHQLGLAERSLADRVYYLNKALNGLDLYYEVQMPEIFMLDHPVGTVIGRGTFGDYFMFLQNCTVGNNRGVFPTFGKSVTMCAYSAVLGRCHIGDSVIIGARCFIKDADVPSHSIVFGESPNLIIKPRKEDSLRGHSVDSQEKPDCL